MKKTLVFAGCMLALSVSIASAAGINLSWNDCGAAGSSSQTWTCDTNTGAPFTAFASFQPPAGLTQFLGIASQLDVRSVSPNLPDWWKHGSGQCRSTQGLSVSFDFTSGPFTCADFWGGQAAGGFQYDVAFAGANRGRLRVQCAVPFDNRGPIGSAQEYYAYKVNLQRAKSSGAGVACDGCLEPMCIVLNDIQLFQPPEQNNDPDLSNPIVRNHVTWQAATVPGCPESTPARNSSWGQVKSLYR